MVSAPKSQTAHSLVAHPLLLSPRAADLPVSPLLAASLRGATVWPQRTLVATPPPRLPLNPSLLPHLLPLLLLLRQRLFAVAMFLLTFVVLAVVPLAVAGESARPQLATRLPALILVPRLLVAATKHLAAASVKTARLPPQLAVAGSPLLAAVHPPSVSPRLAPLRPPVTRAMAGTGPVPSGVVGSRVCFH